MAATASYPTETHKVADSDSLKRLLAWALFPEHWAFLLQCFCLKLNHLYSLFNAKMVSLGVRVEFESW